jgi:signal peptidase I
VVYLKRVLALGGDRVETRRGEIYVNGALIEPHSFGANATALVPAGQLYVLGDNRRHSEDSRYFGTVPESNVIGEPVMVLWSFAIPTREWLESRTAAYFNHPIAHLRWGRFFRRVQ